MEAPPIQYARTDDGVSVAYRSLGSGPPLLWMDSPDNSHLQAEWDFPELRELYEDLAQRFQLLRLDFRGTGLSSPSPGRYALDDLLLDIEAVARDLGLAEFAIVAAQHGAIPAIELALRQPSPVSHLILLSPHTSGRRRTPVAEAIERARDVDPAVAADAVTSAAVGLDTGSFGVAMAAYAARAWGSVAPELRERVRSFDITPRLREVMTPTLVVYTSQSREFIPGADAREAAAEIPGARLITRERMTFGEDGEWLASTVSDFVGTSRHSQAAPSERSTFRTILFTDLESSTALTQRLGDDRAQEVLRGHNEAVRAALAEHDGREVKHTGDGIMASFSSAVSAVRAAVVVQAELRSAEVRVRVGLNAGEPIAEDDDLFGTAVQLARRICDRAEPGQVLVSRVVADLCAGKGFEFEGIGDVTLKGFDEPVALFEVSR